MRWSGLIVAVVALVLAFVVAVLGSCTAPNPSLQDWEAWDVYCYPDSCVAVWRAQDGGLGVDRLLLCDETGCYCMGGGSLRTRCCDRQPFTMEAMESVYLGGCCATLGP